MLVERGVNINEVNGEGDTALIMVAKLGVKDNIRIIQKLLELKCDASIENNKNQTFYTIVHEEALKANFEPDSVYII
jgi:hypothetical protein